MLNVTRMRLRLRALLVGTRFESLASELRWYGKALHRYRFPEMREAELEERRLADVLRKLSLPPDARCIDVGGHIGSFTSLLYRLFPSAKCTVVEASPTKAQWLKRKFPHADIHAVAVANRPGRATFEDNLSMPGYSRLLNSGNRSATNSYYEVEVTTLDDLFADLIRLDLLKIDIEGGELNALKGATRIITTKCPIILFEVGSEYALERHGLSRRDLYDHLTRIGYDVFTFTDVLFDKPPMEFGEFIKCGLWPFRAFNFVARPKAKL